MNPITSWTLIALGGGFGSLARYLISSHVQSGLNAHMNAHPWLIRTLQAGFPWGTLMVNLLGCLSMGILTVLLERTALLQTELRWLCLTGFLGGFTTFSSFGLETAQLLRKGEWQLASVYVSLSMVLGIALIVGVMYLWGTQTLKATS